MVYNSRKNEYMYNIILVNFSLHATIMVIERQSDLVNISAIIGFRFTLE